MRLNELNTILEEVELNVMHLHLKSLIDEKEIDDHTLEVEAINTLLKFNVRFIPRDINILVQKGIRSSKLGYWTLF